LSVIPSTIAKGSNRLRFGDARTPPPILEVVSFGFLSLDRRYCHCVNDD
jgi:hypothetical protein